MKAHPKLKPTLIFSLFILFSACHGQAEKEVMQVEPKATRTGNTLPKLDPKANLIHHDKEGNYWFNSREKGIYRYDGESLILFTKADGLLSHRVLRVQEDGQGNIYFDMLEGINKYDGREFTTLEVSGDGEWKLEEGDLWFSMGWDGKGPYRFDGESLYKLEFPKSKREDKFYANNPSASHSPYGIYHIYKDNEGNIWFGTSDMGAYRYDGKNIRNLYERQLTETPEGGAFGIRSIAEDKEGYFWICNAAYKYKISPDNPHSNEATPLNYKREAGIKGKEGKPYFLSIVADDSGDLWMMTYQGGVWRNGGGEFKHYPVKEDGKDLSLASLYKDNNGGLWLNTQRNGVYKYKPEDDSFEKYSIEIGKEK